MSLYTTGNLKTAETADSSYTSTGLPKKGDYIYARTGLKKVGYWFDPQATKQVGPAGGRGGQSEAPHALGGEVLGVYTGQRVVNPSGVVTLQVDWVNSWWKTALSPKKKGRKSEANTSWVKENEVFWNSEYVPPPSEDDSTADVATYEDTNTGLNSTTLLLLGVGAALLLKKKKGKR